ncbi:class I SAM-dependent methyltransferase [Pseudonocardiaceae bacterium YIM PH 21723]|nr:class I SAM-dependent methyltransferase [Pseudonocardiaceae bacterium YIM PH 21723]
MAPLMTQYLPFPPDSMRAAGMAAVLDEVLLGERSVLLQCGGGASTILLARLLARRGFGKVLAIEHDQRTAAFVFTQLRRENLGAVAKVVHGPLVTRPDAFDGLPWYDLDVVFQHVSEYIKDNGLIDLLVVDGPLGGEPGMELVRYPALPVLRDALSPGATVVLDDIDRPGELRVLSRWASEFQLAFSSDHITRLATSLVAP